MSAQTKEIVEPNPLRTELDRVLGEQMQIIQEQQAQATKVIRVGLTTAGLALTLVSIAVSSDIINLSNISNLMTVSVIDIFGLRKEVPIGYIVIGEVSFFMFLFLIIRLFIPALAVLSPDTADTTILRTLMEIPFIGSSGTYVRNRIDEEYNGIFEDRVTLRTGLDSDKAKKLKSVEDIEGEIIDYHIGCVKGNEAIINTNREYLSRIYTSAALATFLLFGLLIYSLAISIFIL
ncbi:hypothetical protein [Haladaptatus sp. CMAA 1911]|uniref:hypothetical protein n=1 Tax=unclassified Haladaptatus TaxID=2622732 RepID=UPI003753F2AE